MKDNLQPKSKKSESIDPQGTEYSTIHCMPY